MISVQVIICTYISRTGVCTEEVKLKEEKEFHYENYDGIRSMGEEKFGENQAKDRW